MRIVDLLEVSSIGLGLCPGTKAEAIDLMVELMDRSGNLTDKAAYRQGVLNREAQGTTGVGGGIAIPHAKCSAVKRPGLSAMVVSQGVDYEALDGEPVQLFFMIAAPEGGEDVHLEALAQLSTLLMDEGFRQALLASETPEAFLQVIVEKELKKSETKKTAEGHYSVLAVTACPTGIAHTFMAAESLEKQGRAMGVSIKVETQGADGAKNVLTAEEIAAAKGIIIAADKNVDIARFDGKPLISTKVADGIHKPEELITEILSGSVPVHHREGGGLEASASTGGESIGHKLYKHLMNGVSHMLPFVIGGGILIALAFLFDDFSIDPANFGKNTPLAAYLKTIGEFAFNMMLPVLAGYIAMSIADRPGLAVGFIAGMVARAGSTFMNPAGGDVNAGFLGALFAGFVAGYIVLGLKALTKRMPESLDSIRPMLIYPVMGILAAAVVTTLVNPAMGAINATLNGALSSMNGTSKVLLGIVVAGMQSVDMGGPVNKASYVFATSQLAEGNFEIMAAVMAGGMIPPLAIALCTTFFKNRFTVKERQSGLVNYIMGLSFISEGAIPFAASDPLRVIPSCILGSAIAGGLSMLFGCTLRAPHGGIFVLPTIGNPVMYLVSILVGAAAGCIVLGFLKKPLDGGKSVK
ncbi:MULTISPECIES: PTS fructose transporter subunit IIABC [Clostridia]|uniref:PTS fructose transporter subunit IIABC n=1 Tax=Clostridia TaxID=186801 RepID=UPI0023F04194|nr:MULTISPECIES: fructose-specific PTS transporter subunit EIIC [Clostridia]MDD4692017.1 fructose-specific PTS transporter subunit EIIC [Eubacterium aggregans]MEA5004697.1 fructose-specific PTS transporter subunit EIIC [Christensenella sp.]